MSGSHKDPGEHAVQLPPTLIKLMSDTGFFAGDILPVEKRVALSEASIGRVQITTAKDYVRYMLDFYRWLHHHGYSFGVRDVWALDQALAAHLVDLADADAPQRAMRNTRAAIQALHCLPNGALSAALTAEKALTKRILPAKETRPLPRLLVRAVAAHWLAKGGALRRRAAWWLLLLFGTMSRSVEFADLRAVDIVVHEADPPETGGVLVRLFDLKTLEHQQRRGVVLAHKRRRTVHVAVVGEVERAAARHAVRHVPHGQKLLPVTLPTVREWLSAALHALDLPGDFHDLGPFVLYGTRHGACTEARLAGCSIDQVMRRAEWVTGSSVNVYTHFDLAARIDGALRPARGHLVELAARLALTLGLAHPRRVARHAFPPEIVAAADATRAGEGGSSDTGGTSLIGESDAVWQVDEIWFDGDAGHDQVAVVWSGTREVTYEPVSEVSHLDAFAKALFDTLPFAGATGAT